MHCAVLLIQIMTKTATILLKNNYNVNTASVEMSHHMEGLTYDAEVEVTGGASVEILLPRALLERTEN